MSESGHDDDDKDKEYVPDVEENDDEVKPSLENYRKRSQAWKYYQIRNAEKKIARCRFCLKNFNYRNMSNLMKHIHRAHKSKIGMIPQNIIERHQIPRPHPFRKNREPQLRSRVYKHFIFDAANNRCKCRRCGSSLLRDASNLRKHLRRMHPAMPASEDEEENDEGGDRKPNKSIWKHFKCLSRTLKIALCTICDKRIDYEDDDELSTHLVENHSVVTLEESEKLPNLVVTNDGDILLVNDGLKEESDDIIEYVVSDQNSRSSINMETVDDEGAALDLDATYLDESLFENTQRDTTQRREKPRKKMYTIQTKKQNKTIVKDDSLDIFGKYIVSLLRQLPEKTADMLQVDIVRQILTVNSLRNTQSNDEAVSSNSGPHRIITSEGKIHNMTME